MYMIGQNSFSNTNTNPDMITSGSTPAPQPMSPTSPTAQNAPRKPLGTPLIILLSVLGGVLLSAVIYFVFIQPKSEGNSTASYEVEVKQASPDNDGTQTYQETLTQFDKEISSTNNEEDKLDLELNKAGYYIIIEDYDSALASLDTIDVKSLDNYDQYRVYNYYASAYEEKGEETQAARYRQLADEANARELAE